METFRVDPDDLWKAVARAEEVLARGELLIYPTETLYALGGRALDGPSCRRVREAKGREEGKPLPVVASDLAQARSLCATWPKEAQALAERFWPGPLTLVLLASAEVPDELSGGTGTVGVRVPGLALTRALCRHGALISTSANRTGEKPPRTCGEAVEALGRSAALALDQGAGGGEPSTVVALTPSLRLVREGAVGWKSVEAVLAGS